MFAAYCSRRTDCVTLVVLSRSQALPLSSVLGWKHACHLELVSCQPLAFLLTNRTSDVSLECSFVVFSFVYVRVGASCACDTFRLVQSHRRWCHRCSALPVCVPSARFGYHADSQRTLRFSSFCVVFSYAGCSF